MKFRNITIPAEGRNKYGNYVSSTELTKSVVRVTYNGNNTTGGNQTKPPTEETRDVYTLLLSRSNLKFDSKELLKKNKEETIEIIGYVNSRRGDTFIGNVSVEVPETDILYNNTHYDIIGTAASGMSISVIDNGTPNNKLKITCTSAATQNEIKTGTIIIPCSVYKKSGDVSLGKYLTDWASEKENCHTLYLELQWEISSLPPSNAYTLELTNEIAGINCDKDGNIYENAVRPTCKASMYYGTDEVSGVTYSISMDADRNAQGVAINTTTGELTFGSNFSFDGTSLEIRVTGNVEGTLQTKIMTIVKQYAGADGTPAITKWLVPSVNVIKYNPNTNTLTPNKISCKVMKQEGEKAPVEDTTSQIYYGYDTNNPYSQYSSEISIDASKSYIVFALKNDSNVIYEIETIQIIKDGTNGKDGSNGSNGESVYRLNLTNENASINADSDGNIYTNAVKPTCTATLYYGSTKVSNATYSITTNPTATGVSINSSTGVLTFASNFNFNGTSLEITITAMVGGVVFGTAIMSISKNYAGKNGNDGNNGLPGKDGVGISATTIQYGLSSSQTTQPSSWSDSVPSLTKGYYLWTKTTWTYTDGTTETGYQKTYISKDGNNGSDGLPGKDGVGISATTIQYGLSSSEATQPSTWSSSVPTLLKGYYLWTKTTWTYTDGTTETGYQKTYIGTDGVDGTDGINGEDGVSIVWKGSLISHPANPQNGWAYYNTAQKKSFIYQDGSWYQMTVDGTDGQDGQDGSNGLSIVWKGDLASAPYNPQLNWCYRDTDNGKVYIYNGLAWELMVLDGSDGTDGADGADGLSVFITYHDNPITSTPATPTGNGTTNGWHTTATKAANWMSQKVAATATSGTWGAPIQICGADGQDGTDGSDGEDAISYWLDLSATEVIVPKGSSTAVPNSITIKAYKQVGGNTPTEITTATGTQIKWGYNTASPSNTTKTISSINTAYNYIMVHLLINNVIYDRETISILKDGNDGVGVQGRQGAAIRGPVDWKNQTTSRRWCNGTLTNASYPEDGEFIDIVVYDGVYYMCKTSYNGKGSETTAPSSTYWTATDKQYEFVSTNLLLADNAKINFTSSNELYLMDSDGNVTAGAAGGDSVNFWAGANEPENGTFKVYNNGRMEATKGKFGVLEIGTDKWGDGKLYGTHTQSDGALSNITIQPHFFDMEAVDPNDGSSIERVVIAPYVDTDKNDMEGVITVYTDSEAHNGIFTSGMIEAEGYKKRINNHTAFSPFSPVMDFEITFITDTNYFTKSNGYWLWKGMPLSKQYDARTYGYVIKNSSGEWCFATSSTATSGIGTGIYTSSHTKQNNRLYIVI